MRTMRFGLFQCSQHCHPKTYQDDALVRKMIAEQKDMKVPYELIPFCPECGAPLEINKRNAEKGMVESADFFAQKERYDAFLEEHKNDKVLFLEIGVGFTTPQFIKTPFQKCVQANPNALFVSMNHKHYRIPLALREQTVQLSENIAPLIHGTYQELKGE